MYLGIVVIQDSVVQQDLVVQSLGLQVRGRHRPLGQLPLAAELQGAGAAKAPGLHLGGDAPSPAVLQLRDGQP